MGTRLPLKGAQHYPLFSAHVCCDQRVAHLIYFSALTVTFCKFGLKTPIHVPKMEVWGLDTLNEDLSHRDPQKALMVAEAHRLSH